MSEARRIATYEDLMAVPEHQTGEIVHGELIVMSRPRARHAYTLKRLSRYVGFPFDDDGEPGGWWILPEPLVVLGRNMVSPDLAGWRRERMPDLPDDPRIAVVPDWVCEILSPGTAAHDRVTKANLYLENGVRWMWLVDADDRIVEAYEAHEGAWKRLNAWDATAKEARIAPFDAITLDVARLFPA